MQSEILSFLMKKLRFVYPKKIAIDIRHDFDVNGEIIVTHWLFWGDNCRSFNDAIDLLNFIEKLIVQHQVITADYLISREGFHT